MDMCAAACFACVERLVDLCNRFLDVIAMVRGILQMVGGDSSDRR